MTAGERVREVRNYLSLSQTDFGKRLGVLKTAVSKIENNENNLTEQMQLAICREFGVNAIWLTTGDGEIFSSEKGDLNKVIDGLMAGENETAKAVFKALAALGGNEWEVFRRFILSAAHEIEQSEHTKE